MTKPPTTPPGTKHDNSGRVPENVALKVAVIRPGRASFLTGTKCGEVLRFKVALLSGQQPTKPARQRTPVHSAKPRDEF